MPEMTPGEIEAFLREPRVAVLATVDRAGRPRTVPIWFLWEDGAAYLFTSRASRKWRNLLANPAASLCVDHREPPYRSVMVDGRVEESDRPLFEAVRRMAVAYYGTERGEAFAANYRDRPDVVLFRLVPERITARVS